MNLVTDADGLLEAVVECLRDELLPSATGRDRYQLQVCVGALGIVRRELAAGETLAAGRAAALAELGVPDDVALAREIRAGVDAQRAARIVEALRAGVDAEVRVVRPA